MENYVGKRLDGRYEIREIIGVGGMAVVYKAYDNIDGRIVAVKVLKEEYLENEEFRRRFKNESKAIAVLSHPNIVKVFDVSFGNMLQYIVMEYVEGITLKEYIEQQKVINQREAVHFLTQILRALQHAHDKGIIHRDIKPQNILLISDGTIKVTDFGIAHFCRGETKTMSEKAIGSVHYISPEQAKGKMTDAKADLYSVGVVMYEMLTGRLPFQSENAVSVALMQLQEEAVRPRSINPNVAIGLEQIVIRAMQKNSADRYQSAAEMLLDLETFKNNPNVKFDYSYFVDKQPTKFIPAEAVTDAEEPPFIEPIEDESADVTPADIKEKKKKMLALGGVLAGLLVAALILVLLFMSGGEGKVTVPNFVGMQYESVIGNNEYENVFTFRCESVEDESKNDGEIVHQEPSANVKIKPGETVVLQVASNGKEQTVPDVYGYSMSEAQEILYSKGFRVAVDKLYAPGSEVNTVVQTKPKKNASAEYGALVTIYIATDQNTKTVMVPSLYGLSLTEAKEKLENIGLELDTNNTEYRNSAESVGTVIGNERVGEEVTEGTAIAVYVSNGYLNSVEVSVVLPEIKDEEGKPVNGEAVILVNGYSYDSREVALDGSTFSAVIKGKGSEDTVTIEIDGQTVYKREVSFATGEYLGEASEGKYTTEETTTEETTEETTTEETTTAETTTKKPKPKPTTTAAPTETTTKKPKPTTTAAPTETTTKKPKPTTTAAPTETTTEAPTETTTKKPKETTTAEQVVEEETTKKAKTKKESATKE